MDFRHQIVTCLFSMLRLSFETQKIKENYAIFIYKSVFLYVGKAIKKSRNIYEIFGKMMVFSI